MCVNALLIKSIVEHKRKLIFALRLMKMKKKIQLIVGTVILGLLVVTGCSEYKKVLKSDDLDAKYEMAKKLYAEGKCQNAIPLLEDLIPRYSLTQRGAEVYYLYAKSYYCEEDYYLAGYYFKRFTKKFPQNKYTEECAFMTAMCSVKNSPTYSLDQTETKNAIQELQLFLNRYPQTEKKDTCNQIIDRLRAKLEKKEYEKSKLYFHMENYKAAVVSLKSTMEIYPDSKYKEELLYMLVKSSYYLAENSIASKKEERYSETIKTYRNFVNSYEASDYTKELKKYFEKSQDELSVLQGSN